MDRPLVAIDTETANFHGAFHLLELGAVRIEDGEIVDQFASLVRPQVPIEPRATEVHGISTEDVVHAPDAREVLERFSAWLGPEWMVAHNAPFDARVLAFEYTRHGLRMPRGMVLDTLRLSRKLISEAPSHKLPELCAFLGLEEGEHHRALADAVWCAKILEECVARLGGPAHVTSAELLRRSGAEVSILGCAPSPGRRLRQALRPLARACEERLGVFLHYGERPDPPARLFVRPHFIFQHREHSYLEAECAASGTIKTYRLDRVHKVILDRSGLEGQP